MVADSKRTRFEREVLAHLDAAYNLACVLLRGSDEAQDVAQEAFLRAFKYFDGFHGDNVKPWLLQIVRNCCFTWVKSRPRLEAMTFSDDGGLSPEHEHALSTYGQSPPAPDARLVGEADRRTLREGLDRLPAEYREVLVLRELEELSYKEIAEVVGVPVGTVMSRLSRARTLLLQQVAVAATRVQPLHRGAMK